jgi:hypothetical protein
LAAYAIDIFNEIFNEISMGFYWKILVSIVVLCSVVRS